MRVELAALVALPDIHPREVPYARHLHVLERLHNVRARDRAARDDARAAPGLCSPRDLDVLRVPFRGARAQLRGAKMHHFQIEVASYGERVLDKEGRTLLGYGETTRRTVGVLAYRVLAAPVMTDH